MRHRLAARRRLAAIGPHPLSRRTVPSPFDRYPMWTLVGSATLAGVAAGVFGGPVAAVVAACYAAYAVRSLRRAAAERRATRARTAALDVIGGLAADLRAGMAPPSALGVARRALEDPDPAVRRALGRVDAACEVSERLGAPLADLLDRVETDLRAAQRVRLTVRAHTVTAHTTSMLLVCLPVLGLGLGASLGVDPLNQLLYTPAGAGCAVGAVLLQCGGLALTARLIRGATAEVR